jgi:glucosamine-6-phosphate deaminase
MHELAVQKLRVNILDTKQMLGSVAAADIADRINHLLGSKDEINIIFAAAPSQDEMLHNLIYNHSLPWNRINAFQLDEYIDIKRDSEMKFSEYLKRHIFNLVDLKSVNLLEFKTDDGEVEIENYANILANVDIDIALTGIGENGHIAFNDPETADFNDPLIVKRVKLEESCRMQQVHDRCFDSIDAVPKFAATVTLPYIMKSKFIYCCVPGFSKRQAVKNALQGAIGEWCPATILRTHDNAVLYIDKESATLL